MVVVPATDPGAFNPEFAGAVQVETAPSVAAPREIPALLRRVEVPAVETGAEGEELALHLSFWFQLLFQSLGTAWLVLDLSLGLFAVPRLRFLHTFADFAEFLEGFSQLLPLLVWFYLSPQSLEWVLSLFLSLIRCFLA